MDLIFDGGSLNGIPLEIGDANHSSELNITICRFESVVDANGNEIMRRILQHSKEIYQIDEEHRALFKESRKMLINNRNWVLIKHG